MDINLSINYVNLLFGLIEKPINYNMNVIYSNDSWSLFINLILNGKFEFPRLVLVNFNQPMSSLALTLASLILT